MRQPNRYGVDSTSIRQEVAEVRRNPALNSLAGLRAKVDGSPLRMAEREAHEYEYYGSMNDNDSRKKKPAQLPSLSPSMASLPTLSKR